jgi:hypothetical protein
VVQVISPAEVTLLRYLQAGDTLMTAASAAATIDTRFDPSPLLAVLFQAGALITMTGN